jgi:three-Cys-motif partner protein
MPRAKTRTEVLVTAEPDGLKTTEIGRWALDKYRVLALYAHLFSRGMKNKWLNRVYIDLCAGSGLSQIEGTDQLYYGSPLLAMGVPDPFNRYILCERDEGSLSALRQRVSRLFPQRDVRFVLGQHDEKIKEVAKEIPRGNSVLSFCFIDPFDLSIKFSTIRYLSTFRLDLLLLLMLGNDANRNVRNYTNTTNHKIDEFLGLPEWRNRWHEEEKKGVTFVRFLAETFNKQMEALGYLPMPFDRMKSIRSDDNHPLYHLALFSKNERAYKYWDEVITYSTLQRSLFLTWAAFPISNGPKRRGTRGTGAQRYLRAAGTAICTGIKPATAKTHRESCVARRRLNFHLHGKNRN